MDIFAYSMLCFTSLFTLMDPLGVMPVFLQMTEGMSAGERRSIALKSCALTFVILVLFTLCGRFLFHFFGISTNGFRIAGGIIIFKIPMLCGPGVISSGITLMEDAPEHIFKIALVCVIALVCLLSFIILCVSTRLLKILGETGNNVMMRLMGLILMVIAVECFINGMQPVLTDILRQAHACP